MFVIRPPSSSCGELQRRPPKVPGSHAFGAASRARSMVAAAGGGLAGAAGPGAPGAGAELARGAAAGALRPRLPGVPSCASLATLAAGALTGAFDVARRAGSGAGPTVGAITAGTGKGLWAAGTGLGAAALRSVLGVVAHGLSAPTSKRPPPAAMPAAIWNLLRARWLPATTAT